MTVSSVASSSHSMSADVYATVCVKQEPERSSQDEQTELTSSGESRGGNWCRADVLCGVQVKQEPSSPVAYNTSDISDTSESQLSSFSSELTCAVSSASDAELDVGTSADQVTVADVNCQCGKSPSSSTAAAAADRSMMSSELLACLSEASQSPVSTRTVSSPVCSHHSLSASASDAVVSSRVMPVSQELVKCRDSLGKTHYIPRSLLLQVPSSSAVNCTKSQTESSQPPTSVFLSPRSINKPSVALSRSRMSTGKCDILSSVCETDADSSTKSVVTSKYNSHITPSTSLCTTPVQTNVTAAISVSCSVTNSTKLHCTVSTAALTTVTLRLSAHSTSSLQCRSYSTSSTSVVSSSHSCLSTRVAPSSQQVYQVCLTSDKHRDTSVPYSVLNSAIIKPRPLVPLCGVNSPARSLPHIAVLPSISSVVTASRITTPYLIAQRPHMTAKLPVSSSSPDNSVIRTQRPHMTTKLPVSSILPDNSVIRTQRPLVTTNLPVSSSSPDNSVIRTQRPLVTTKLPVSSSSPVYFVVGGNNKVTTGNSRAMMEVVLVPATKETTRKASCSTQRVTATELKSRCISIGTSSAGLSRCNDVGRVSDCSLSSAQQSVVCLHSLTTVSQTSHSSSSISLHRPQNVALSTVTTKPSLVDVRAQTKRSSSSNLNVFATKIGNKMVIVDIGNLSSISSASVKPSVTSAMCVFGEKTKDMLVSKSACSQQHMTSVCGNIMLQTSAACVDRPSTVTADEVSQNSAPVIRYFNCLCFLNL